MMLAVGEQGSEDSEHASCDSESEGGAENCSCLDTFNDMFLLRQLLFFCNCASMNNCVFYV